MSKAEAMRAKWEAAKKVIPLPLRALMVPPLQALVEAVEDLDRRLQQQEKKSDG